MPKIVHRQDLVSTLAKAHRRSYDFYREVLDDILTEIQRNLADGREVRLTRFGTFYTRTHKGGKGLNFKTKQPVEYKATRQAAFKAGTLLKEAVRRKKSLFSR